MSLINVRVQPRASRDEIIREEGDVWWVRLAAPPVGGKANAALVGYLARVLGVPKGCVAIGKGLASRQKTVSIERLSEGEVRHRLRQALGRGC